MGRNAPNLYELLKAAGGKPLSSADEEPHTPPRAAGRADESASTGVRTETPPPMKIDAPRPETPESPRIDPHRPAALPALPRPATPTPRPAPSLPATRDGLGERRVALTYNTAAFIALVAVGVVFLAYAIGVRVGRSAAAAAAVPAASARPAPGPLDPAGPPEPPPVYTIRLMEWPARNRQESANAMANASRLKNALDSRQLPGSEAKLIGEKYVLNLGRFTDLNARDTKEKLATIREFRLVRNQDPVFRSAGFVRAD